MDLLAAAKGVGVKVVDGDAVFLHDLFGNGVVLHFVSLETSRLAFGDGRRRGPDEFRFRRFEAFD